MARRRHDRRGARAARGRRHRPGAVLARRARARTTPPPSPPTSTSPPTPSPSSTRSRPARRPPAAGAAAAQGRHRPLPRRRPARDLGRRSSPRPAPASSAGDWTGHRHLVALRLQRRAGPPGQRRAGGGLPGGPRGRRAAGLRPEVRHLANSAAAILRPSARFDLVRCGIASYGLDPAPGRHPRPRAGPGDDRPRPAGAWSSGSPPAPASPTATPGTPSTPTTVGLVPVGYGDGVPRHAGNRAEVLVGDRRRPVRGPDLHGPVRRRPRRRRGRRRATRSCSSAPAQRGEPTAQDWAEACGTISYEIVTRIGGRFERRHVDERDRAGARHVSVARRSSASPRPRPASPSPAPRSASPAAAGSSPGAAPATPRRSARCGRGRSRSSPTTAYRCTSRSTTSPAVGPLTVVFAHGYALNLDCWHFQRAAYRGLVRTVFYDQRSHGRSGRSTDGHATIDQLGATCAGPRRGRRRRAGRAGRALDGRHEHRRAGRAVPELFGDRVVGVGADLDHRRRARPAPDPAADACRPALGSTLGAAAPSRLLARGHRAVDGVRRLGPAVAMVATDQFAFGDDVPAGYVEFVDEMLSRDAVRGGRRVLPELRQPSTSSRPCEALGHVPIVGHLRHRRQADLDRPQPQAARRSIPGSRLLECEGAGHMVILERHEQVNAELDQLLARRGASGSTSGERRRTTGSARRRRPTPARRGPAGLRGAPAARPAGRDADRDRRVAGRLLGKHGGLLATLDGEPVGGLVLDPVGSTMYLRRFGVAARAAGPRHRRAG